MKKKCIPTDITIEILSRVPARCVIRFRCVCKLWLSITHTRYFIDAHLNRARKSAPPSILLFFSGNWDRKSIAVIDENSRRAPKRSLWRPAGGNSFVGNGLVCIYEHNGGGRIQVINPVTGESLTLPENTEINIGYKSAFLGFQPETKEYKVICFFFTIIPSDPTQQGCQVYTLGANNWRPICIPHHCPLPCRHPAPVIVKGTVYWLTTELEDDPWKLVSFDLKSETFAWISLPNSKIYQEKYYGICRNLVELQDSVFFTISPPMYRIIRPVDIWMLTENNNGSNNTKFEWALKYSLLLPICHRFCSMLLIHNDKILVFGYEFHNKDEPAKLMYCHLNSKGQGHKLFYREEGALSPRMYDYLKGEYEGDKNGFYFGEMFYFEPFVHINSLFHYKEIEGLKFSVSAITSWTIGKLMGIGISKRSLCFRQWLLLLQHSRAQN